MKVQEKTKYLYYYLGYILRSILNRLLKKFNYKIKPFYSKPILNEIESNELIRTYIEKGKPFIAGRIGSNEISAVVSGLGCKMGVVNISSALQDRMYLCAGFFPSNNETLMKFSEMMLQVLPEVDILGCWNDKMEDYLTKYYMQNTKLIPLKAIEPYYYSDSTFAWSKALKGKKVLVIHPFVDTIEHQYKKRKEIFPTGILPEFQLVTMKAVQTIAGEKDERFETWFEALDYMIEEALKLSFDIALIGCGAYGLPLAIRLKQNGKQAIHMGGALQILFGIKGSRWDVLPYVSCLYNDAWVRPEDSEKTKNSEVVENSCYW